MSSTLTQPDKALMPPAEVAQLIETGQPLVLAGTEEMLDKMPPGNWIGGTIPFFLAEGGGQVNQEAIFVNNLADNQVDFSFKTYDKATIPNIATDGYDNGYTVLILPLQQEVQLEFAVNSLEYEDIFKNPIIGFVTAILPQEIGQKATKTYYGPEARKLEEEAVALHAALPDNQVARLEILNIFDQEKGGDTLTFPKTDFFQDTCYVNGEERSFADYLNERPANIGLPLVSNYAGARINVSFMPVEEVENPVNLASPVFPGETYKLASPTIDYVQAFSKHLPQHFGPNDVAYSVNCFLNYHHGGLQGRDIGFHCPVVFGEIGYQQLNQTFTYLIIDEM